MQSQSNGVPDPANLISLPFANTWVSRPRCFPFHTKLPVRWPKSLLLRSEAFSPRVQRRWFRNSALCVSGGSRWLVSASGNRAAAPVWTRTIREIMSVMDLTRRCRWLAVQFGASSEPIQYALLKKLRLVRSSRALRIDRRVIDPLRTMDAEGHAWPSDVHPLQSRSHTDRYGALFSIV